MAKKNFTVRRSAQAHTLTTPREISWEPCGRERQVRFESQTKATRLRHTAHHLLEVCVAAGGFACLMTFLRIQNQKTTLRHYITTASAITHREHTVKGDSTHRPINE